MIQPDTTVTDMTGRLTPMSFVEPEPWVTIERVADHLGLTRVTINRLMKVDPPLPSHKFGRSRRFRLTEVDRWAQSRCIAPVPDLRDRAS